MSAYPTNNMYGANGWQQATQNQQWQNMSNEYAQSNEYAPMSNQNALDYAPSSSLSYYAPSNTSFSSFSPSTSSIYSPYTSNSASDGTGNIINYGSIYNITGNNDVVNTGSGTLNYNSADAEPFSYFEPETAVASPPVTQYAEPVEQYCPPVEQCAAPIQQYTPPLQQYAPPMMQSLMASNACDLPWMQQNIDPMQDCNIWDQSGNNTPQFSPYQSCDNNDNQLLGMLLQFLMQRLQANNTTNTTNTNDNTDNTSTASTTNNLDPANNSASDATVWGDPHFDDSAGHQITDMIAAGDNSMLVSTDSSNGAHIIGQTNTLANDGKDANGTPITIFTNMAVNLGDGTHVELNADGSANLVDANGKVLSALSNGQTVTSSTDKNDAVTYNATNKTLNFNFADTNGSNAISGVLKAVADSVGNDMQANITSSTGNSFGGMLPALQNSFVDSNGNPISVNESTGAGAFKNNMTNTDFQVASLFS